MDYKTASQYWINKDKDSVKMKKEELFCFIEEFLKNHNTMALATCHDNSVRCTPIEYNYYDGNFYLFSEGGQKFSNLEANKNVSASIFEAYTGFQNIHSIQITGTIEVIEPDSDEFAKVCTKKGLNMEALKKMNVPFHLLKLAPSKYEILDSTLKKLGYSNRQTYEF